MHRALFVGLVYFVISKNAYLHFYCKYPGSVVHLLLPLRTKPQMGVIMHLVKAIILTAIFTGSTFAEPADQVDGHFSSWKDVPRLIESTNEDNSWEQLRQLHQLTRIKLGYSNAGPQYLIHTKQEWRKWWESTGKPVSIQKEPDAKVDQKAFQMAWEFLGIKQGQPKQIVPVWIPETWTIYVTFTNGDYGGREKEVWIIDRQASSARMTKLRGDYGDDWGDWKVVLKEFDGLSPEFADQILKALCYTNRYAPAMGAEGRKNELGLYYPHSTLRLRDGKNRILWNTEGYDFSKTRPEFGDGESGRSYYFLHSFFSDQKKWKVVQKPTSEQLAPYRMFLSFCKPSFCSNVSDIVQMFGQRGGSLEKQALLEWAEKQMASTNPEMDWKLCSDEFGTSTKESVINSTRHEIQETLLEIKKIGDRLEAKQLDGNGLFKANREKEQELDRYIVKMLATKKREIEEALLRIPQPLRDLIIADDHPDDPNLKHLSAAIQAIRDQPDPKLFKQLVERMDEGTVRIRMLLKHILLNERDRLKLKPWGHKEEAIAINACIDALPVVKIHTRIDLVEILLHVNGGGSFEIEGKYGGSRIVVTLQENGYSMSR
ncbi:MAG: hypothetical protein COA78_13100, partial [Blastopirellula sp.]